MSDPPGLPLPPPELGLPLVVDLDHTLILTDSLVEQLLDVLFRRPTSLPGLLAGLKDGRAAFKARVSDIAELDCQTLPFNDAVLELIRAVRAAGSSVHLVTAADQRVADAVAQAVGGFDSAVGSDGLQNLKGQAKAAYLNARFPQGFTYVGDSLADLPVWQAAARAVVAADSASLRRLKGRGLKPDHVLPRPAVGLKVWAKALRLHQWLKNSLILVPIVLAHQVADPALMGRTLLAFVLFGMMASSTYLINDLSDLAADRAHPRKRRRPLASGRLSPISAGVFAGLITAVALGCAFAISFRFGLVMGAYLALTLLYSFRLKREPLIDVVTIGVLFMMRVVAGMVVIGQPVSLWLASFTAILFTSLALAKRHAELVRLGASGGHAAKGRGYLASDTPLTAGLGLATAVTSILVVLLYLQLEAAGLGLYRHIGLLFLIPLILASWLMRVWIKAHRGLLDDDPVTFAIKDKVSWVHAVAVAVLWAVAVGAA
jgi:4-hydroxybenzoate polyprenyltransferase/phosphoserine phosphatase